MPSLFAGGTDGAALGPVAGSIADPVPHCVEFTCELVPFFPKGEHLLVGGFLLTGGVFPGFGGFNVGPSQVRIVF